MPIVNGKGMIISKKEADQDGYIFFLDESDPSFIRFHAAEKQLYWFSTNINVAKSHAAYWKDQHGNQLRLTLECSIIYNLTYVENKTVIYGVRKPDIIIIRKLWW